MSAVLAISVTLFSSCKKADVYNKHQDQDEVTGLPNNSAANILGKWHVVKTEISVQTVDKLVSYTQVADPEDYFNFNAKFTFQKLQNGEKKFGMWKIIGEKLHLNLPPKIGENNEIYDEIFDIQELTDSELVLNKVKDEEEQITGTTIYLIR